MHACGPSSNNQPSAYSDGADLSPRRRRYLEAIEGIEQAITGKTFDDFSREWVLRHAIQRAIEIISEASRSIPDDVKATRAEIPWVKVSAIGNILRHEYHALSD